MRRPRKFRSFPQRALLGAAAGFGATLVLHQVMAASAKLIPDSKPPMKQDPGKFMAAKANVPAKLEPAAAKSLQLGYGVTAGALYGAARKRITSPILEGAILGIAVWAVGYLGWLPAADLMPPITQHSPKQIAVPIANHIVFGLAVATAFDGLLRV
jgi:hypothetical protein